MATVNDYQVGGEHYKSKVQHWDFIEGNGIGYLEGCATKYVTRWRKKNGAQDLEKAVHYIAKLAELNVEHGRGPRGSASNAEILRFAAENALTEEETTIIRLLSSDWSHDDLLQAKSMVEVLLENANASI